MLASQRPLVINWHLTEACNYRCRYCYSAWEKPSCKRELIHSPDLTLELLRELYAFFQPGNRNNPLSKDLSWDAVRINLAGGEPLLHEGRLPTVISQARRSGFEVSMISNASRLGPALLAKLTPELSWLGISLDSADPEINRVIGRMDRHGQLLDLNELTSALALARQQHPSFKLKLNTVVNRLNHTEDLSGIIRRFAPDKWKVLRMLPVLDHELAVTDEQFATFLNRHHSFASFLTPEDNTDMRESYLMIDPHGRFFQNSQSLSNGQYEYSQPILQVGALKAFLQVNFSAERYRARYIPFVEKYE